MSPKRSELASSPSLRQHRPGARHTGAGTRRPPLLFPASPPGEEWRYDNSGYVLLGAIPEKVSGQSRFEVLPSLPGEFLLKAVDAQFTFVHDAPGTVTQLILHQGVRDVPGKKNRWQSDGKKQRFSGRIPLGTVHNPR